MSIVLPTDIYKLINKFILETELYKIITSISKDECTFCLRICHIEDKRDNNCYAQMVVEKDYTNNDIISCLNNAYNKYPIISVNLRIENHLNYSLLSMYSIKWLHLQIVDVNSVVLYLPQLVRLVIGSALIDIPNFQHLPSLKNLVINALVRTIPNFDALPNLSVLWIDECQHNCIIPDFRYIPRLTYLKIIGDRIGIPNFTNLPLLEKLTIFINYIDYIPLLTHCPLLKCILCVPAMVYTTYDHTTCYTGDLIGKTVILYVKFVNCVLVVLTNDSVATIDKINDKEGFYGQMAREDAKIISHITNITSLQTITGRR